MFIGPVTLGKVVEMTSWVTSGYLLLIPVTLVGFIAAWLVKVR
jgi:hypothetical protein